MKKGAFTVLVSSDQKILLVKRRDYPIWDLPGGQIETFESHEEAAIREAQEETGFVIEIDKQIGSYFNPECDDIQILFLGHIIGGQSIIEGPETKKISYFSKYQLPLLMVPHRRMQIRDALNHESVVLSKIIHDNFMIRKIKKS